MKKIIHHDQVGFVPEMQGRFHRHKLINGIHHINRLKKRNHVVISSYAERAFDRIPHHFVIKVLENLQIQGTYFNMIKAMYNKPIHNTILNSKCFH